MTSTIDRPAPPDPAGPTARRRAVVRRLPDLEAGPAPPPGRTTPPAPPGPSTPPAPPGPSIPPAPPAPSDSDQPPSDTRPRSVEDTVRAHAHVVLRLVLEVLDGRRPPAQLAGVLTERARRYVGAARGRLDEPAHRPGATVRRLRGQSPRVERGGRSGAARLRSMRVCHPVAGVAEVSAVWCYRGRSRALAARFELTEPDPPAAHRPAPPWSGPPWRCTELRLG